jgi:hypothetical protein
MEELASALSKRSRRGQMAASQAEAAFTLSNNECRL